MCLAHQDESEDTKRLRTDELLDGEGDADEGDEM